MLSIHMHEKNNTSFLTHYIYIPDVFELHVLQSDCEMEFITVSCIQQWVRSGTVLSSTPISATFSPDN